ncbi:MAG: hypothetical protein K0B06_10720 [Brevefilum sp.]|nr:hypothetical protein [Brevefilum sp.]
MTTEPTLNKQDQQKPKFVIQSNHSDAVYGIGIIGAWVYFFKHAATTGGRIKAFFKGFFWPAFLVYELFVFLNKE